jgi:hypothetical protein
MEFVKCMVDYAFFLLEWGITKNECMKARKQSLMKE